MSDVNELIGKYPMFFELRKEPKPFYPIAFGIECGNGWYDLLDKLFQDIVKICEEKELPIPKITQIKEKFAALCFYVESADSEIFELIHEAERVSRTVCETCGKPGNVKNVKGWYITICDNCLNNK